MLTDQVIRIVNSSIGDQLILKDSIVQQFIDTKNCICCGCSTAESSHNVYSCSNCGKVLEIKKAK